MTFHIPTVRRAPAPIRPAAQPFIHAARPLLHAHWHQDADGHLCCVWHSDRGCAR